MIDKISLKEGAYYIGTCRNTNIAKWYNGKFIFINLQFGNPYIETIDYYGDVKNMSFDGFIPMEEIVVNVDNIVLEKNKQDYKNGARKIYQKLDVVDLRDEVWKPIPNYEGLYSVSNMGRIKKHGYSKGDKIMRQNFSREYLVLGLGDNYKKRKTHRVHRLVAMAFKEKYNKNFEVNHINGIKSDNRESNLEWISHSENTKHSYTSGNIVKKLTPEIVREIMTMIRLGDKQKEIAKKYGISCSTVCEINKGKKWKNIML